MSPPYQWRGFTHQELSLIVSHVAGGNSLCCRHNHYARCTVTNDPRKRRRLASFAHEAMGCRARRSSDETWKRESATWLEKLLKSV